jgi:hypothetical protein
MKVTKDCIIKVIYQVLTEGSHVRLLPRVTHPCALERDMGFHCYIENCHESDEGLHYQGDLSGVNGGLTRTSPAKGNTSLCS